MVYLSVFGTPFQFGAQAVLEFLVFLLPWAGIVGTSHHVSYSAISHSPAVLEEGCVTWAQKMISGPGLDSCRGEAVKGPLLGVRGHVLHGPMEGREETESPL